MRSLVEILHRKLHSFRRPDIRDRTVRELDALLIPARERYIICRQTELSQKSRSAESRPENRQVHLALGPAHVARVAFLLSEGPSVEVEHSIKEEALLAPRCFGIGYSVCRVRLDCPVSFQCMKCQTYINQGSETDAPGILDLFELRPAIDDKRERFMIEYAQKVAAAPEYAGRPIVITEHNVGDWPPIRETLEAMVAKINSSHPTAQAVIAEIPEPLWLSDHILASQSKWSGTMEIYEGGKEGLNAEGLQVRARLVKLADRIKALDALKESLNPQEYRRLINELQQELAAINTDTGKVIVYNDGRRWLRTATDDADMLLQFLINQGATPFFGLLVYTSLDENVVKLIQDHWNALDRLTGNVVLLFAFEATGAPATREPVFRHHLAIANSRKRGNKNGGIITQPDAEILEHERQLIVSHKFSRDDSALIAAELGIERSSIPCLIIWEDMASDEFLVYSFQDKWVPTGEFTEHVKEIIDILAHESEKSGKLAKVEPRLKLLKARKFVKRNISRSAVETALKLISLGAKGSA
jgi:hypothetical protein